MMTNTLRPLDPRLAHPHRFGQKLAVRTVALMLVVGWGCRPADILTVPTPAGVVAPSALRNGAGAAALRAGTLEVFSTSIGGFFYGSAAESVVQDGALLGDELTEADHYGAYVPIDSRSASVPNGFAAVPGTFLTDQTYSALQQARINALNAASALEQSGGQSGRSQAAEMFAVVGYTELFLAESFCSGVPLGQLAPGGGVVHGIPLTTDSLFATAAIAFDSALADASDSIQFLARVGLGRALVGRGRFAAAKAAVAPVPTGFTYSTARPSYSASYRNGAGLWSWLVTPPGVSFGRFASVADAKGGNGANYVSAHDPRMPIDSGEGQTDIGTTLYYPLKFPLNVASDAIPLADGLEARLIEAEAALWSGDVSGWAAALNALRADSSETQIGGLLPLTADSTATASPAEQVDVMFRERAFWLYGTGRRLGDLRRLVRQYGQNQAAVFPTGPYHLSGNPMISIPVPQLYGSDVNFPILAAEAPNPNFHGCLNRSA